MKIPISVCLTNYGPFVQELGVVADGDGGGGAGDFDNAKHAWAMGSGKMQDDNEKMKSAALFLMSKHGDPKACSQWSVKSCISEVGSWV